MQLKALAVAPRGSSFFITAVTILFYCLGFGWRWGLFGVSGLSWYMGDGIMTTGLGTGTTWGRHWQAGEWSTTIGHPHVHNVYRHMFQQPLIIGSWNYREYLVKTIVLLVI